MRLRNNPQASIELAKSDLVLKTFPFKLKGTTILELGMGKGEMISALALQNPEVTYLGIERSETVAYHALRRIKELNLTNVFIICGDIKNIARWFEGQAATIWLTFSDPWPKKRHAKRRLTNPTFLKQYQQLLTPGGKLKLKTDNKLFFAYSTAMLEEHRAKIVISTADLHHSDYENVAMTGYERKWSLQKQAINYLEAIFT